MKSLRLVLTYVLIFAVALSAFAGGQSEEEAAMPMVSIAMGEQIDYSELEGLLGPVPSPSRDYTIGAIEKTLINEHWQQMKQGYEDRARELGVTIEVAAAENEQDLTGQLDIAETMLSKQYDALSVSPLAETNLVPALESANSRGIPIINVDDARITSVPNVFVGANHRTMAVLAAEYYGELFRGQGPVEVALIEGLSGSSASIQRVAGFTDTVAADPDLELVASLPGDWDRVKALNAMESILQANPNVRAVYACNDTMALGAMEAVINAGKVGEVLVIGTDGVPAAQESIQQGLLTGTIAAFPYSMGEIAVEVAIRLLEGQEVPEIVTSPMVLVTEENFDEYF